ncbi:HAD family hydrolase [Mameliella sp. CS4]|uniref:sulfotransferase-like domain-containing protein n=1 Tax=Mameliella sp. CS4 TaxID=2862329 RepID=UPI001C6061B6|nr:HAD family hydrolase [Mameliella sp. CS4]MBW4984887.1 HAD family hydrolase [Mameliella sp. CS4]
MNIACWSGPRNLSTAMMYAFGARPDCGVWDEPFYAAYLTRTGIAHPMGAEIVQAGIPDPVEVARRCAAPAPGGQAHFYLKLMTHHHLDGDSLDWADDAAHVFLIRHPARVLASYAAKRENPTLADIGFAQQCAIFDAVRARGWRYAVIDSFDIRRAPEAALRALCGAIGLDFDPAMLAWPAGGHADDGVWASHWYDAVHRSTGFAGAEGALPAVAPELSAVHDAALPHYQRMRAETLRTSA